ncbi:unnamed protein product [Haemonchus placei]|uniref:Peptidase C1A papain C-terminal domain-containing protein n=1 Tax=Haemonchus placei TaxID=6290 RepID=A0A3P7U4S5_HAEPC|nr:unnamed protein product [Haemonchus placei]
MLNDSTKNVVQTRIHHLLRRLFISRDYHSRCDGGYAHEAWAFALTYGVVTGGGYKAKGVCRPYPFHPCGFHHGQFYSCPRDHEYVTPVCKKYCQYGYGKRYEKDKIFARTARILDTDEKAIQKEIMINGPVQAAFTVYEDFSFYKKGIYVHTGGKETGGHAVKIIGWGVENGTKYWTIANSWHDDWGEDGIISYCTALAFRK